MCIFKDIDWYIIGIKSWPSYISRPGSFRPRSSVDSAFDWGSEGRRFNPGRGHPWKKFTVGGFQFMVFLIPWVPNMMVWTLFLPGKNLLFKLILTGCVTSLAWALFEQLTVCSDILLFWFMLCQIRTYESFFYVVKFGLLATTFFVQILWVGF